MAAERVQKILAQVGIASRRKAEELIQQGLVTINGKVAQLGDKADVETDAIKVEGRLLQAPSQPIYLALHKPRGVISALADPEGRQTIVDLLDKVNTRVFPIGNLEYNAEGLLLLTNDGKFANELQNRGDVPWVYHVKVKGEIDDEKLGRIQAGAMLNHRLIKPISVRVAERLTQKAKLEVVLLGPGGSELKTLFETRGFLVERITRTAIGNVTLHGLEPGHFRYLKKSQAEAVLKQPELALRRIEQEADKAAEKEAAREKGRESRDKVERAAGRRGVRRAEGEASIGVVRGERAERPAKGSLGRGRRDGGASSGFRAGPRGPSTGASERRPPRAGAAKFGAPRGPRGEGRYEREERGPRAGAAKFGAPRGPRGEGRYEREERGPRAGAAKFGAPRGDKRPMRGFEQDRARGGYAGESRAPKPGGFGRGPRAGAGKSGGAGRPSGGGRAGGSRPSPGSRGPRGRGRT